MLSFLSHFWQVVEFLLRIRLHLAQPMGNVVDCYEEDILVVRASAPSQKNSSLLSLSNLINLIHFWNGT